MPGLAAKVRAKYPGAYDDVSDADLERQVLAKHPEYADLATPQPAEPRPTGDHYQGPDTYLGGVAQSLKEQAGGALKSAVGFIRSHPAEVGATVGGLVAAPFTAGTSLLPAAVVTGLAGAAGAGAGLGIKQAASLHPVTPSEGIQQLKDTASQMATQGAIQGAGEVGGRLVSAGLKAGGARLYQSVLKPTVSMRAEYPDLVTTAIENGIPVSREGAAKAGRLVTASKGAADQLVQDAAAQPNAQTIDPRRAVGGITKAVQNVRDLPVARPQMKAIGDYARQYLSEHPSPISLPDAQQAVRATDRFYDPAYRASIDRGNPVTAGSTAAALGINDETRNLLRQAVPGLQEQNATTRGLMGVREAVERRADQLSNNGVIGMRHGISAALGGAAGAYGGKERGAETFLLSEALTNPAVAARLAIAAGKTGPIEVQQLLRAAILAQLGSGQSRAGEQ